MLRYLNTIVERIGELVDEQGWRYGIVAARVTGLHVSIAADYLSVDYSPGFVFDNNDNELEHHNLFAARLAV